MPDTPVRTRSSKSGAPQPTLLNQGIEMVRHISHSGRSLGLTEIARQMGLPKSSVFRTLAVLGDMGFVQKSEDSGRYALNPAFFSFVYELTHHFGPSSRFDPILREYAARWGYSIFICMLSGRHSYVVSAIGLTSGSHSLGSHCPVFASSAGKVIVSRLDESEWPHYGPTPDCSPPTPYANTRPERFLQELAQAKAQGVAWNIRETSVNDVSVAAFVPEADQPPRLAVALLVRYKDLVVHDRATLAERALQLAARLAEETRAAPLRLMAVKRAS